MRSFQIMRYGRRIPSSSPDVTPTMKTSCSFTSIPKHKIFRSFSSIEQYENRELCHNNDQSSRQRRNTLLPDIDLSSRRLTLQQQDLIELKKPRTNLRNFYIFFLLLFFFLFFSLVYSFMRMMKNAD